MTGQTSLLDLLDHAPKSRPPIARWLIDHLVATGHMTPDGLSRRARLITCTGCKQLVLAGLDDDWAALEAHVDPIPLTPLGEMLAAIEGRRTYELNKLQMRWEINSRDARRIAFAPAGSRPRADVVRQHRCDTRDLSEPETTHTSFAEAHPQLPADAPPPF